MKKFELSQRVSAPLALALILVLGFVLSWYSLTTAEKIIENSKESTSFNVEVRMQKELLKK